MKEFILIVVSIIMTAAVTGWLFLTVAKVAVLKVKQEEEARHQELLKKTNEITDRWMDIANGLRDEIVAGHFTNKSIRDQLILWQRVVEMADADQEPPILVDLTKGQETPESDE